jgi:hypothetical protein
VGLLLKAQIEKDLPQVGLLLKAQIRGVGLKIGMPV